MHFFAEKVLFNSFGCPALMPLPHNPDFKPAWGRGLLKTMYEREKMLETSIFSLSHNVF